MNLDPLPTEPCLVCGRVTVLRGGVHAMCAVDTYPQILSEVEQLRRENELLERALTNLAAVAQHRSDCDWPVWCDCGLDRLFSEAMNPTYFVAAAAEEQREQG